MPSFEKTKYAFDTNSNLQVEPLEKNAIELEAPNDDEQSQCDSPVGSFDSLVFDDQVSLWWNSFYI